MRSTSTYYLLITLQVQCHSTCIYLWSVTRSSGTLIWHNQSIPSNQIWIKLGGDKGHGSFKFNLQLCNIEHPNSLKSTTLVSVFKAGDSTTNLHTALDMYKEHVSELQGMTLKYGCLNSTIIIICTLNNIIYIMLQHSEWNIKIFLSGDYEYLCKMYGLSGASGKTKNLNLIPANHQVIL